MRPDLSAYRWKLAGVLGTLGEHEQAIEHLRQALAIDPRIPQVHHNLGVAFEHLGRLEQAADCQREALRLDPSYAQAHNHLGNVLRKLGRTAEAADCHRRAIALRPNYAEAFINLATRLASRRISRARSGPYGGRWN